MRRAIVVAFLLAGLTAWLLFRGREHPPPHSPSVRAGPERPSAAAAPSRAPSMPANGSAALSDASSLAEPLNAPDSTIQRDLSVLAHLLDNWRSNFPREGNPVGENHEITAALMGDNRLQLVLIPKHHRALNPRGELCDRWGTPFRFHQISGERMEIFSAGPDRKFGTADDVAWSPGGVESTSR